MVEFTLDFVTQRIGLARLHQVSRREIGYYNKSH